MKYFTKELWTGWQSDDWEYWDRHSSKKWNQYLKQLSKIRDRLKDKYFRFFSDCEKYDLHDGRVVEIRVSDKSEAFSLSNKTWQGSPRYKYPMFVEITVFDYCMKYLYLLKYDCVRKVSYDFPSENILFFDPGGGMGDWGYHELTPAGKEFLRHEILFASGTTFLVEFKKFSFKRRRISVGGRS